MNDEPSGVSVKKSLKTKTISFDKIPHQSRLFLDFQSDAPEVEIFYPEKQTPLGKFADKVLSNYEIERNALCDVLTEINQDFDAGEKTFENIALLRENDCLAVVTGQQAGLFSGSLYTVYKALSAVKFCENLKKQNIKTVPIFWIAEEDHDFDEIKKTFVAGGASETFASSEVNLIEIENTPESYVENTPVGLINLDKTINETIEELLKSLSHTEFTKDVKSLLTETYKKGETFGTAFGKFLAKIFARYGLIFLAPTNEKLKKLCSPIFASAIERSDELTSALLQRSSELENRNYSAQVLVEEDSFPFFYLSEKGERLALRRDARRGKITARNSSIEFDKETLKNIAKSSPQSLSPNALMRPVAQDYLLPTLLYVGGAAEIAYFAQNAVIYEILKRPATPIRHRASFTIVEPKNRRTLEKYDLNFSDLFRGKKTISAEIVEKFLNAQTARVFAEVEEEVNTQLNRLDTPLLESEPTLSANLANRRRKIIWHIEALRKKYHRAEILKHEIVRRRMDTLFTTLLPRDALQERTLNATTFLHLYGENFIEWIYQVIEFEEKKHQILYL